MREYRVALVGNPNVGKTSLFNALTGSDERVGNWHGVTVRERRAAFILGGDQVEVVDLPGTYSLTAFSEEERVTAQFVQSESCDLIVYVASAVAYERGLPLLYELQSLGKRVVVVWNRADELARRKGKIDLSRFFAETGVVAMTACAHEKRSIRRLKSDLCALLNRSPILPQKKGREAWLSGAKRALTVPPRPNHFALDKWLLRPYVCLPLFVLFSALALTLTFAPRSPVVMLSDGLSALVEGVIGGLIRRSGLPPIWKGLLANGICSGVGGVLCFLPQVVALEWTIWFAEETGFLARVAYLCDGLMQKIGLNGRAAFTLVSGLGCTATAAITARGSENDVQKKKTVLLLPCLPCSARIPVFLVLIDAFFARGRVLILLAIYLSSLVLVALVGGLLDRTVCRGKAPFIMELPPYQLPNAKRAAKLLLKRCKQFIIKIGKIVVLSTTALWALGALTPKLTLLPEGQIEGSLLQSLGQLLLPLFRPMGATDWRLPVVAISGLAAKEAMVGTLAVVYPEGLCLAPSVAAAFLAFTAWYSPCLPAVSAMAKETGKGAAAVGVLLQTALSFFAAYTVGFCFAHGAVATLVAVVVWSVPFVLVKRKRGCGACRVCRGKHERIRSTTRGKTR